MKIALVAPSEIPARRANTIQVMKMAAALADIGHTIRLAAPSNADAATTAAADPAALMRHYGLQRQIPIERLQAHPRLRRYDYAWRAVRWARDWPADMLYTRLPQAAALAGWLGLPTVYEVHDLPHGRLGPAFLKGFIHSRGARRLAIITRALADDLEQLLETKLEPPFAIIAPDGVDLQRYAGLPEPTAARSRLRETEPVAFPLPPDRFTAGYTGHLYPGRGIELLIAVAKCMPEINFLIVGGDPEGVDRAREQARGLSNIHLTGFVPNADLPAYQAACDALLMPYAGQVAASSGGDIARYLSPMKLFEYLACGRAIVCADLPVLSEVLNSRNSLLLPINDPEAWRLALERLQQNPELTRQLGSAARQDATAYTWENRARSIFSFQDETNDSLKAAKKGYTQEIQKKAKDDH